MQPQVPPLLTQVLQGVSHAVAGHKETGSTHEVDPLFMQVQQCAIPPSGRHVPLGPEQV